MGDNLSFLNIILYNFLGLQGAVQGCLGGCSEWWGGTGTDENNNLFFGRTPKDRNENENKNFRVFFNYLLFYLFISKYMIQDFIDFTLNLLTFISMSFYLFFRFERWMMDQLMVAARTIRNDWPQVTGKGR